MLLLAVHHTDQHTLFIFAIIAICVPSCSKYQHLLLIQIAIHQYTLGTFALVEYMHNKSKISEHTIPCYIAQENTTVDNILEQLRPH